MPADAFSALSQRLCPWLRVPLSMLESAYGAGRLGHAWLIAGPIGLGKLNFALVVADRLLHGKIGGAPPPELAPAEAVDAMATRHLPTDHHPDLHWVFPLDEKRTIGIEQIREATETLALTGFVGGPKVVVIEPAEAMTMGAANALLKALEEPSGHTYLLLVSHQPGRLPSTIRSRCHTLRVQGPPVNVGSAAEAGPRARTEPTPLVRMRDANNYQYINMLEDSINLLGEKKREPLAVVDEWVKGDVGLALDWLVAEIQQIIRARFVEQGTGVTDASASGLHNLTSTLTLGALFAQLTAAERLRDRLGSGINTELGLRVLLLGFTPERG